jgi:hypothetical protein
VFLCEAGDLECPEDEDGRPFKYRGGGQGKKLKRTSSSRQVKKNGARSPSHGVRALVEDDTPSSLDRRASGTRKFVVDNPDTGGRRTIEYDDEDYPSVGDWDNYGQEGTDQQDNAYALADYDDCNERQLVMHPIPLQQDVDFTVDRNFSSRFNKLLHSHHHTDQLLAEHIVEMNMPPVFFAQAAAGTLPSDEEPIGVERVNPRFFIVAFRQQDWLPALVPALPGGSTSRTIALRLPVVLGSNDNRDTFVILENEINGVKNRVSDPSSHSPTLQNANVRIKLWQLKSFINGPGLRGRFQNSETSIMNVVATYRDVMGVFDYLATPRVHRHMITILNNLRHEFQIYQDHWNALYPADSIDLVAYWDV